VREASRGVQEIAIEVSGDRLDDLAKEAGGHRFQRIPPTERRGRVHTSSVTVAVLDPVTASNALLERRTDDDFRVEWFQSLGAGGQHANKHQNSARVIHIPTGLKQESRGRSRESNFRQAKESLVRILDEKLRVEKAGALADTRKSQMGSGMRGDKIRTIRFQDDIAKDHQSGKQCPVAKLMDGNFDLLW
jgi:peptide chain release factor 1